MRWSAVIMAIEEEIGIVKPNHSDETIQVPIKLLPKDSREGDILQFTVLFDPYSTIISMEETL